MWYNQQAPVVKWNAPEGKLQISLLLIHCGCWLAATIANVQIKSIIWNMQPKISFTDTISTESPGIEPLHLQ